MEPNDTDELIFALSASRAIIEYKKAFPQESEGLSNAQIWEMIRTRPVTIENLSRFMANETKVLTNVLMRLEDLEVKLDGLLKKERGSGESTEPSSGLVS